MDYTYTPPPPKANDGWMSHRISIFVNVENRDSFWKFLENYCGPKGQDWRLAKKQSRWIWGDEAIDLRFRFKKHAMVVKLQWQEDEDPKKKIFEQMKSLLSSVQPQSVGRVSRFPNLYSSNSTGKTLFPWHSKTNISPTNKVLFDYKSYLKDYTGILKILADDQAEEQEPASFIEKCRERGDAIMTSAMLEARLAGSTSLPVLYRVRPGERSETGSDRTSGGI
jgi:hypothetical protein